MNAVGFKKTIVGKLEKIDRMRSAVILFGVFSLVTSLVVTWLVFNQNLQHQKTALIELGARMATRFDHELSEQASSVKAMGEMANDLLSGGDVLTFDPIRNLTPVKQHNGYMLNIPTGYSADNVGSMTGEGTIPEASSAVAKEMRMAVSLTPLFRAATRLNAGTPWVYYTSASRFSYVYPRSNLDSYFFTSASLEFDVFRKATPQENPNRTIFWTPAYLDEAGKGLMVSVCSPVYAVDAFKGTLCIDISLSKLSWIMDQFGRTDSTLHLVERGGKPLVNQGPVDSSIRPDQIAQALPIAMGDDYVTSFPLESVAWNLVLKTPRKALVHRALDESLVYGLILLLLFASLALIALLTKSLRSYRELSIRDSLTGLYNRRFFEEICGGIFGSMRRDKLLLGLILIDIDNFKEINDGDGHQAGDKVLRRVAMVLVDTLQRASDRIFRVGGDEFSILVSVEDAQQLKELTERLSAAVSALDFSPENWKVQQVTVSLGAISVDAENWVDAETACKLADAALYRAKKNGRGGVEITSSLIAHGAHICQ